MVIKDKMPTGEANNSLSSSIIVPFNIYYCCCLCAYFSIGAIIDKNHVQALIQVKVGTVGGEELENKADKRKLKRLKQTGPGNVRAGLLWGWFRRTPL